ncbi:hypothetical protein B0T13DRAFT_472146 [Neurospora crassa]|nr:hypothetical protein B0T13DRAFT_472146 [Neurospora crassa]
MSSDTNALVIWALLCAGIMACVCRFQRSSHGKSVPPLSAPWVAFWAAKRRRTTGGPKAGSVMPRVHSVTSLSAHGKV